LRAVSSLERSLDLHDSSGVVVLDAAACGAERLVRSGRNPLLPHPAALAVERAAGRADTRLGQLAPNSVHVMRFLVDSRRGVRLAGSRMALRSLASHETSPGAQVAALPRMATRLARPMPWSFPLPGATTAVPGSLQAAARYEHASPEANWHRGRR